MADETRLDQAPLDHGRHDRELVAAYAAHDLERGELARAESLVAACPECASLAADLRTISVATRSDAAFGARAPRDFRLSPEAAARARRWSLRDTLATLERTIADVRRPLGAAVATLGLAGILVFGVPLGPFLGIATGGSAGSARDLGNPILAPVGEKAASAGSGVPTGGPNAYRAGGAPVPASSGGAQSGASTPPTPSASAVPATAAATGAATVSGPGNASDSGGHDEKSLPPAALDPGGPGRVAIGVGSVVLVVVGGLLAITPSRRRRRD